MTQNTRRQKGELLRLPSQLHQTMYSRCARIFPKVEMHEHVLCLTFALFCVTFVCAQDGCQGRCFTGPDYSKQCQCNEFCEQFDNCCYNFYDLCRGSESCSAVSALELARVFQDIYNADDNRLDGRFFQVNFQQRYAAGVDSSQPFFTHLNESIFQKPTYSMVSALADFYEQRYEGQPDDDADDEMAEIETFVGQLTATGPMRVALDFLITKGCINSSEDAQNAFVYELWFNTYPPSEVDISSKYRSGFEHVFLGELRGSTVLGLNNWVTFYLQEKQGRLNYLGWIDYIKDPNIVSASFEWLNTQAPIRSFFVGASPEFEMAVATVCATVLPEQACPLVVNNKTLTYQTYIIRHKLQIQLAAAFPIIPLHTAPVNATGSDFLGR